MAGEDAAPAEEAGVAEYVRAAHAAGAPILVRGAATKLGMLRPVQAAGSLSTANLTGTTLYAPKELVVSARAGTPIAEIEQMLAAEGQHLIAEPPDYGRLLGSDPQARQTLGGVVATNLSGPRRVAWGAMRDHVLGVRAVDGTGTVIRSGGRVLKNVTGLDLCKLLTGSHGTLGVMTEITLKVLPAPEASGSVVLRGLGATQAVAALSAAIGSPYGVSGAAFLPADAAFCLPDPEAASLTIVRVEEFAPSVRYRLDRLRHDLAGFGAVERMEEAASRRAWAAIRDATCLPADEEEAVWRISVRPSRGPAILEAAAAAGGRGFLDWSGGLALVAGPATEAAHRLMTASVMQCGGVWTLLRAPLSLRTAVDVVPPEAAALARLTARVKAVLDPGGILNPGRLFAGT